LLIERHAVIDQRLEDSDIALHHRGVDETTQARALLGGAGAQHPGGRCRGAHPTPA